MFRDGIYLRVSNSYYFFEGKGFIVESNPVNLETIFREDLPFFSKKTTTKSEDS